MSALAEGLGPDRREGGRSSIAIPPGGGQQSCEHLEGVQPELPPVLSLEENPVVIPIGQQLPERSVIAAPRHDVVDEARVLV
jgi:hypothetical protein